jgi:RNA polymerase sigma-70 factor (ECF subfamily)
VASRFEPDGKPNGLFRLAIRIARNLAINETRRMRAAPIADELLQAEPDPHGWVPPDPLLRKVLQDCHEALPDKPKEAMGARLASQGGEADEVLAQRLHMRLNTFLQNITRARRLLAGCLEKHGVQVDRELFS